MPINVWGWLGGGAIGGITAALVQFRSVLKERSRRAKKEEIALVFVKDMATNHLPHIYHVLRQMAEKQGIKIEDPPHIQFIELNGNGGH